MEHPIDVLLVMAYEAGLHGRVPDEPKIKIDRHQRSRIILPNMLCQRFAVDEVLHLSARDLGHKCVPSGNASRAGVKDVVFFPVWFGTESPPGSSIQSRPDTAPSAIRQVLEIKFAVVRIPWRL